MEGMMVVGPLHKKEKSLGPEAFHSCCGEPTGKPCSCGTPNGVFYIPREKPEGRVAIASTTKSCCGRKNSKTCFCRRVDTMATGILLCGPAHEKEKYLGPENFHSCCGEPTGKPCSCGTPKGVFYIPREKAKRRVGIAPTTKSCCGRKISETCFCGSIDTLAADTLFYGPVYHGKERNGNRAKAPAQTMSENGRWKDAKPKAKGFFSLKRLICSKA